MLEPKVKDYIKAVRELGRDSFCRQIQIGVVITKLDPEKEAAFQSEKTELMGMQFEPEEVLWTDIGLEQRFPVLELRKSSPGFSDRISLGRSEKNDLVVLNESISSKHVEFVYYESQKMVLLRDLQSKNGTLVNNKPIEPRRAIELLDGDLITIGNSVFVFFTPDGFFFELTRILDAQDRVRTKISPIFDI